MFRLFLTLALITFIAIGVYTYYTSQKTFQAKFKNIDGLPKGAEVTALGVKVGEVIRAKPISDGILVTIRIKNKSYEPEPGSQLTITSFRPNQGRILEIIPPKSELPETKAWIVQEPITTESWLHASLELLDNLKSFSQYLIAYVTPENFEAARTAFSRASESLSETAGKIQSYNENLLELKNSLAAKGSEANALLIKLQKPINSLNKVINDKKMTSSFKGQLDEFSDRLNSISQNITKADFYTNLSSFKTNILDQLNQINASLIANNQKIKGQPFSQKLKSFNEHLTNLNQFYDSLNENDIKKIAKDSVKKAKEATIKASMVIQN